jgi:hypothetical protein
MLALNTTLRELDVDGSFGTDVDSARFFAFIDSLAASRLVFSPFPRQDACDLIQKSEENRRTLFKALAEKQHLYEMAFERKQTDAGVHSDLSRKDCPELSDLLDRIARAAHERIKLGNIRQHRAFACQFGLPIPFLDEDKQENLRKWNVTDELAVEEVVYGLEHFNWVVMEENEREDGSRHFKAAEEMARPVDGKRLPQEPEEDPSVLVPQEATELEGGARGKRPATAVPVLKATAHPQIPRRPQSREPAPRSRVSDGESDSAVYDNEDPEAEF